MIACFDALSLYPREGRQEEILEGACMLLLSFGIAWLIFRLRRLTARRGISLGEDTPEYTRVKIIFIGMAFLAIGREGFEVIRPLYAMTTIDEPIAVFLGVAMALLTAFIISWALHNYLIGAPIASFRKTAWLALLFIGAGLLTNALHEFTQAGLIPSQGIPSWGTVLFGSQSPFGYILLTIVGDETVPTFNELLAFSAYLILLGWVILRAHNAGGAPHKFS
jgi:high-affinity iron transporter